MLSTALNNRNIIGFFYGLFMDSSILLDNGISASNPRLAFVENFELRIGQRATLVPAKGGKSYGMLYTMAHDDIERLYSGPGLDRYYVETILAQVVDGDQVNALCYNLKQAPAVDQANENYTLQLTAVMRKLGFPDEYVASLINTKVCKQ
jgi:hypothetical protein